MRMMETKTMKVCFAYLLHTHMHHTQSSATHPPMNVCDTRQKLRIFLESHSDPLPGIMVVAADDEDEDGEDGDFQEYTPYGDILGADAEAYQDDEEEDGDFKPDAEPEDFDIPEDEEEEDSVLGKHPRTETDGA